MSQGHDLRADSPHTTAIPSSRQRLGRQIIDEHHRTHSTPSSPSDAPPRKKHRSHLRHHEDVSTSLLSELIAHEEIAQARKANSALLYVSERLDLESQRANDAERRLTAALARIRTSEEAKVSILSQLSASQEELRLYKRALDDAQAEIKRAQEIVDGLERALNDAEERAARARDMARKWREIGLVERAREEGRREGLREGIARGRQVGWYEGRADVLVEEDDEDDVGTVQDERQPSVVSQSDPDGERTSPSFIVVRSPPRGAHNGSSIRDHTDAATHTAALTVPTMTTPLQMPSPMHAFVRGPDPFPIMEMARHATPSSSGRRTRTPHVRNGSREGINMPAPRRDIRPRHDSIASSERSDHVRTQPYAGRTHRSAPPREDFSTALPQPTVADVQPVASTFRSPELEPLIDPIPRPATASADPFARHVTTPSDPMPLPATTSGADTRTDVLPPSRSIVSPVIIPPHPTHVVPGQGLMPGTAAPLPTPGPSVLATSMQERIPSDQLSISQLDLVGPPPPRNRRTRTASAAVPRSLPDQVMSGRERSQSASQVIVQPTHPLQVPEASAIPSPSDPPHGPRRPRHVVMPAPLAGPTQEFSNHPSQSHQAQQLLPEAQPERPRYPARSRTAEPYVMVSTPTPPPARTRTPLDWLLRRRKTQVSNDPTPPQIFIEPPSQTVSTISSARTEAHLLTPEHAERPLPAIPSIDEALQAILGDTERPPAPVNADAAIPDLPRPDPTPDQFRDPTNSTVSPLTTANLTSQVDPAIPRVTELPLGFVPVRNETDYFSLKHEPLGSTLERIRADARSPSDRSLREDGPERYAAAPVPPGVVYPDLRGGQRLSPVGEEYLSPNRLNRPISLFSEE